MSTKAKTTKPRTAPAHGRSVAPRVPQARAYLLPRGNGRLLTNKEKGVLCQLAKKAYDHLAPLDLVDGLKAEAWRRKIQLEAVGKESLTDCQRDDWRPLAAAFYELLGWSHRAFIMWMTTGKVSDNADAGDTHESREELGSAITRLLVEHGRVVTAPRDNAELERALHARKGGGAIGYYYVEAIARAKFRGRGMEQLDTAELRQMRDTIKNRIAAREGVGSAKARNKSQRAKTQDGKTQDAR